MPEDVEAIKNEKSERAVNVTIYVNLLIDHSCTN